MFVVCARIIDSSGCTSHTSAINDWDNAQVKQWFVTYKNGKYQSEYEGSEKWVGFEGIDGEELADLTKEDFTRRSSNGDLLFNAVAKLKPASPPASGMLSRCLMKSLSPRRPRFVLSQ